MRSGSRPGGAIVVPPRLSRSRRHLQIELDGWDVIARDLDSRGGTTIAPPGRDPERMKPGDAYVLEPGTVLDMAHVYSVRYESGAVAR